MKSLDLKDFLKKYSLLENTKVSKRIEEKLKYFHFGSNQNVKISTFGIYDFLEEFFKKNKFISSHYISRRYESLIGSFPINSDLYELIENDKLKEPSNSVDYFLLSVDFELAYSKRYLVEEIWRVLKVNGYLFILDLNKFHFTNYIKQSPFHKIAKIKTNIKLNWFQELGFELESKDQINICEDFEKSRLTFILTKFAFFYFPFIHLFIFKKKLKPNLKGFLNTNISRTHLLETQ